MALQNNNGNDCIELEPLTKQNDAAGVKAPAGALCTTPKPKRAAVTKKLQFTTPEFSVTPIPTVSGNSRLLPSRRRLAIFLTF